MKCQEIGSNLLANLSVNKSKVNFNLCQKFLEYSTSVGKANKNIIIVFKKFFPYVPKYVMALFSQSDKSIFLIIKAWLFPEGLKRHLIILLIKQI